MNASQKQAALLESDKVWDTLQELHADVLDATYDDGVRHGYAEAIRAVRAEVEGKTYSRAVRALLTRVHNEFKEFFS